MLLVWTTNKTLSIALASLTLFAGILPAGIAYVGAMIVDAVIHAADLHRRTGAVVFIDVLKWVA
ncbi:MAG: ABC transporter ATP-binding protein, partial [Pseudomonadota bacterium]|nr:ABC transporter ATP-binding protein [Pseudomonadota bacterium]